MRKNCATINSAIYAHGETVLKNELKNAKNKKEAASALIQLYKDRIKNVPSKTKKGLMLSKIGAVMLNCKIGSLKEQYNVLDEAFTTDQKNVINPRYIYTYFELYYKMYTSKMHNIQLENLLEKFEKVNVKFEYEKQRLSDIKDKLLVKKDKNQTLTTQEQRKVSLATKNIAAIVQFSKNMSVLLEKEITCETLTPLLEKKFETNRNNLQWLRKSASRLDAKECVENPLFIELIKAIDVLEPTANSKYYLYKIYKRKGDEKKVAMYLDQYMSLETDGSKKAKILNSLGSKMAKNGQKSKAREFFRKALKVDSSSGNAYINLARLYASSANECGTDEFSKRATYWKAVTMARKAAQVDASKKQEVTELIAFYIQAAPSKTDIFKEGYKGGEKIEIKCWIGGSVIIPKL